MGNPNEASASIAEEGKTNGSIPSSASPPPEQSSSFQQQLPPAMPYGAGSPERRVEDAPPPSVEVILTSELPKRNLMEAYILGIPLGFLGAHHYYLRRWGFGAVYMLTLGLFGIGWIVDWFRMPCLVREANRRSADPQLPRRKSLADAYVLWFPFGLLGFHHYYLRRWTWGVLYTFTLGILGLGWLFDIIRMPSMVKAANEKIEMEATLQETIGPKPKRLCDAMVLGMTPLGLLGAHHFYLGRPGFGVTYMFSLGLGGIGWIVDWFRMKWLVDRTNRRLTEGDYGLKHLDDAYVLCFPFGFLGLHHFYLNRPGWGILYLCTIGCFGIGWLIDWFRLPCLVREVNNTIEKEGQILAGQVQQHLGINPATTLLVQTNGRVIRAREGCVNQSEQQQPAAYGALDSYPPSQLNSGQILQPPSYEEAVYSFPAAVHSPAASPPPATGKNPSCSSGNTAGDSGNADKTPPLTTNYSNFSSENSGDNSPPPKYTPMK